MSRSMLLLLVLLSLLAQLTLSKHIHQSRISMENDSEGEMEAESEQASAVEAEERTGLDVAVHNADEAMKFTNIALKGAYSQKDRDAKFMSAALPHVLQAIGEPVGDNFLQMSERRASARAAASAGAGAGAEQKAEQLVETPKIVPSTAPTNVMVVKKGQFGGAGWKKVEVLGAKTPAPIPTPLRFMAKRRMMKPVIVDQMALDDLHAGSKKSN